MFLACSSNGNILFLGLKHLVSWAETKCFDVINVYETKSSFHRRCYLNGAKKRQKRLVVHCWCIDDYQFYASIHCLTNWNTVIYKENVGMYREMQKSEWKFLCDQRDCDQRDCPQWFFSWSTLLNHCLLVVWVCEKINFSSDNSFFSKTFCTFAFNLKKPSCWKERRNTTSAWW